MSQSTTIRQVPFFPYPKMAESYQAEYRAAIDDVMRRGAYILQADLQKFEQELASFHSVRFAIGVADGTNAIVLLLKAVGIGAGDEVILPSHTYVATAAAVREVGATPVLVECGDDHLICIESTKRAISKKTKALLPVHLNGRICEMQEISALAEQHGLLVLEDGAQAFGARYAGASLGSFGVGGTLSFYPAKILGCFGDGGAVLTNHPGVAKTVTELRDHGRDARGEFVSWGTNSRLDNLQAAIMLVRMKHIQAEIDRRREIASLYAKGLGDIDDLVLPPAPGSDAKRYDSFQNYEIESSRRDQLKVYLEQNGVRSIIQWGGKAVHQIEALGFRVDLPQTEKLFERCLLLPMNPYLSDEDVAQVVGAVRGFYGKT